jgi:hypothetical protein
MPALKQRQDMPMICELPDRSYNVVAMAKLALSIVDTMLLYCKLMSSVKYIVQRLRLCSTDATAAFSTQQKDAATTLIWPLFASKVTTVNEYVASLNK